MKNTKGQTLQETSQELRRRLLGAHFADAREFVMALDSEHIPQNLASLDIEDTLAVLKLRAMCAEVLDYWGLFTQAAELVLPVTANCKRSVLKLFEAEEPVSLSDDERRLLRQQIWLLLHAGMVEYRRGSFDNALEIFATCDRVGREHLATACDPAWGTRARAQYSLGLVYRERLEVQNALKHFTASVENAWKSIDIVPDNRPCELSKLTYVAIAKNLGLGLAFMYATIGRPDLAFPLLVSAKSILQPLDEKLISAYVDVIYANVLRGLPGNPKTRMEEVLALLKRSYSTFRREDHVLYQARAAYYLALSHLQRARPDESVPLSSAGAKDLELAEAYTEDLKRQSDQSGDIRFGQYRFVLRSRIQRKRDELDEAEETATQAIEVAATKSAVLTDALLSRGEVRLRRGDLKGAGSDFEQVLRETSNPRVRAICLLQLCRLHSRAGNYQQAAMRMTQFEDIEDSVTHLQLEVLAREARAEMASMSGDLVLRLTDGSLDAAKAEHLVRRFLVNWARARSRTDTDAAKLLGISRPTFYNWYQSVQDTSSQALTVGSDLRWGRRKKMHS